MFTQPKTFHQFLRARERGGRPHSGVEQLSPFLFRQVANFGLSLEDALWINQYTKLIPDCNRQYEVKKRGLVILHSGRVLITREQVSESIWNGLNSLAYCLSEGGLAAMCMNLFTIEQIISLRYYVNGQHMEELCSEKGLLALRAGRITLQHMTGLSVAAFRAYLAG